METLQAAAQEQYDFVEFDVQRSKDNVFFLYHDNTVLIGDIEHYVSDVTFVELQDLVGELVTLEEAIRILHGKTKAHVDFKFVSPPAYYESYEMTYEVIATRMIVEIMGSENCIITTMNDESVLAVRQWSEHECPELLVGLSLGKDIHNMSAKEALDTRVSELFPTRRLRDCKANLVVANKELARYTLADYAQEHELPLLVWTVDSDEELNAWLHDERAWLVTTNFPRKAVTIRKGT